VIFKGCSRCGEIKIFHAFCRCRNRCLSCHCAEAKRRRDSNPEAHKAKKRNHYQRNREYYLLRAKYWRQKLKDFYREYYRKYRVKNRRRISARKAEWRDRNRDKISAYGVKYYAENRDKLSAYRANNRDRYRAHSIRSNADRRPPTNRCRNIFKMINATMQLLKSKTT
jgi:hypothetical protein